MSEHNSGSHTDNYRALLHGMVWSEAQQNTMTRFQDYEYVIQAIVDKAKETRLENGDLLFDAIRSSHNRKLGTINGEYIHMLMKVIDSSVNNMDAEKVANAYNVIAATEDTDTIQSEEVKYNFIAEMFLEPVLDEIL